MDIRAQIIKSHSVETATAVAEFAEQDEANFQDLLHLVTGSDEEIARRAAWSLGKAGEARPEWMIKYLPEYIQVLNSYSHPAIGRNIYRALQYGKIPEKYHAQLYDLCLKEINDLKQPTAIRVFAMTVAANIAEAQNDLKDELKLSIAQSIQYGTAGFKNRGSKILRSLK